MADVDKEIYELPEATNILTGDAFALGRGDTAMKILGETLLALCLSLRLRRVPLQQLSMTAIPGLLRWEFLKAIRAMPERLRQRLSPVL